VFDQLTQTEKDNIVGEASHLGEMVDWGQDLRSGDKHEFWGIRMAVVAVDERGRLTIPKEYQVRKTRATIIPSGSFFIVVPLPSSPLKVTEGWLPSDLGRRALKDSAEKAARKDAVQRAKRRKQL